MRLAACSLRNEDPTRRRILLVGSAFLVGYPPTIPILSNLRASPGLRIFRKFIIGVILQKSDDKIGVFDVERFEVIRSAPIRRAYARN